MRINIRFIICTALLLISLCCVPAFADSTVYTDMDGTEITLPKNVTKIVNLWGANHMVLAMLGHCDTIVGTTSYMKKLPWFEKFCPHIMQVPVVITNEGKVNIEEMYRLDPDTVITTRKRVDELRSAGLNVVNLYFDDYAGLKETVVKTAEIFGPEEIAIAKEYIGYFDRNLKLIQDITKTIPADKKKKILYIRPAKGAGNLVSDGNGTMASQWSALAGGVNIADAVTEGWGKTLSMEYVLEQDPDIIILMDKGGIEAKEFILSDAAWQEISAVKNNTILVNPSAVFYWERYGAEEALQILWAAKVVHPELFSHIDIEKETRYFYKTFFNYELNETELTEILNKDQNGKI